MERERGLSDGALSEVEESDRNLKRPMVYAVFFESQLFFRGSFPTVRATAVGRDAEWNAVLAGDLKVFRLLCNTNLNMNIPSRGSGEERIRILLQVWANIQSDRYNK